MKHLKKEPIKSYQLATTLIHLSKSQMPLYNHRHDYDEIDSNALSIARDKQRNVIKVSFLPAKVMFSIFF